AGRWPECALAGGHRPDLVSKLSDPDTSTPTCAGEGASAPSPRFAPLLARQHQELGVGGQYFPHRILEFTSGFHTAADVLDPFAGNVLHLLLAAHHEGEGPDGMAWALGAVAVGL